MLARFSITARIFGGFAAVVALLMVVAVSAFFGIRTLSTTIDEYNLAIGASGEISDYVADFHAMEVSAREYLLNPSAEVGEETLVWIEDVATNDAEGVAKFAHVDGAVETLARIETEADALHAAFTEVMALGAERATLAQNIADAETQFDTQLTELLQAAQADGNFAVAILAGSTIQNALHMQQAATRYLQTRVQADYESVRQYAGETRDTIQEMTNSTFTIGVTEQLTIIRELVNSYEGLVDQVNANLTQQQAITTEQLLVQREALIASYDELTTMLRTYQEELGPVAQAAATSTELTVVIVGLLSVLVGVGLAFVTGRWLSKAIGGMSDNMRKLADGQLDIELSGSEQRNELGLMAQALEVFKSNGQAMKEAEAAKERERAEELEEQRLRDAMQQEVARVVAAASDGDFSARITDHYDREDLDGFAQSLNDLMSSVERGVTETGQVLSALAGADLTLRVEGSYKGAFHKLKEDTNSVGDKLTDVISQLKTTSRTLKTATGEILSGANDLSERTTKQAATIEETSAAMEQLSSTVGDNAKKAESAATSINQASRIAEEGGEVMGQATTAMERITNSSSKISNIIGMIDDIAFQTNLLALNASVEAARAGEAGKGFAVVAVEVRRLAQSAAEASSEVKTLIEQSASEVDGGSKLVAEAAEKLASMLEAVKQNSTLMNEISTASREQASSIDEVNTAVRQMDEMTQHNAALVEETNAAIEQTESQANDLDRIVAVFTVRDGNGNAPAMSAAEEERADKGLKAGIRGLQQKVSSAAKSYLSNGNAAVDADWEEF